MGTNFYQRDYRRDDDPDHHIGKRSAAGFYCWDCRLTLCKDGNGGIHFGRGRDDEWYKACPSCGAKPAKEALGDSTAGRELGFNQNDPSPKRGVASCSSFTWAMTPERFRDVCANQPACCPTCERPHADDKVIENEYGDLYSLQEFEAVLSECPIQFTNSMGTIFA